TRGLAELARATGGRLPLSGGGGVDGPQTAYEKIRAGASAVQLYTALVWQGLGLVPRICAGLGQLLARDGFASVADAVGTGRDRWL
ncbi:MAG: dihydroorotate dehydrogenase 2, partial [Gemmobacter sp.]